MTKIAVSDLRPPTVYVRTRGVDQANVAAMIAAYQDAGKKWVFPPVIVRKVQADAEHPEPYELVEGVTRWNAALAVGVREIPAEVRRYADDTAAFADQVVLNMSHGLRLSLDDRDQGIRVLKAAGWPSAKIADATRLTVVSVNRIVKGEQRTGETGKRSKAAKGRKKKKAAAKKAVTPATPAQFFEAVELLLAEFRANHRGIIDARGMVSPRTLADFSMLADAILNGRLSPEFELEVSADAAEG